MAMALQRQFEVFDEDDEACQYTAANADNGNRQGQTVTRRRSFLAFRTRLIATPRDTQP